MRPADANETACAWKVALERDRRPGRARRSRARRCRRSTAPSSRRRRALERGAYTLWESIVVARPDPDRDRRRGRAHARGRPEARRRTAPPCASSRCRAGSSSRQQPADYRDEVLPPEVKARLSVEPGVALGWKQWVGDHGDSISIEHFGASAPGDDGARAVRLQPRQRRRARGRAAGAGRVKAGGADQGVLRARLAGLRARRRAAGGAARGHRGAHDGHAIARVGPTAACCRSASRSTRARSRGSRSCEGRGRVRPPRRAPARRGARGARRRTR